MRAIALVCCLVAPFTVQAFDYAGDEALRREAGLTVQALAAHGFPEPDSVELAERVLTLSIDGMASARPLPPAGGTLVETLIGAELDLLGPSVPEPLFGAALAYLSARTRGTEWAPHTLQEALLQAFVLELVKDDPERLGGLWKTVGAGESWTGMERWFAFQFGRSPEEFFARSTARTLPHLLPFLDAIPSAAVRAGETEISIPPAAPLTASALELAFPSGMDLGLSLAWDGRLPAPTFLLVSYGPPLNHFDLIDLAVRDGGITVPLTGVARLVLLATDPSFARSFREPVVMRGIPAERYPCELMGLDLTAEEAEAALSFTAASMADVSAFVVLRETAGRRERLEPVGFLPGLGKVGDPFAFTLVDPERPPVEEAPVYHLYAITADGLMAFQGSVPLGPPR